MIEKKILITGCQGFLGLNFVNYYGKKNNYMTYGNDLFPNLSLGNDVKIFYHQGDLTDTIFSSTFINNIQPDYILNTVAMVDLDECESNAEKAYRVNVLTARNISRVSAQNKIRMIHISTDHFFDGKKSNYSEDDIPNPVNNYGLTKLAAERECLDNHSNSIIIRTNFYGWSHPKHRPTFGEWLYESLSNNIPIKLFTNYYFTPIEVTALAEAIEIVMNSDFKGIINIAGAQRCSKYEFGMAMAEVFGFDSSLITPVKMLQDSFKVKRQPDLSLSIEKFNKIFSMRLPDLRTGLQRFKNTKPENYKKLWK